ncbi:MAG TPA: aminotransferase class IV [Solirubrobacterales bacterium]|jgi:para-aminobenzoate synthetase/4-amino-4-deoxychorismate lyase|nr:aminotransferase class IV [Solirubrobacterales bacterium]
MSQAPATQNTPVAPAVPAPDLAQGLFETLLILDGRPVALVAHLERLAASLDELYAAKLPARVAAEAGDLARGLALGRMRIDVDPTGAGAAFRVEPVDPLDFFPDRGRGAALRSALREGGLGRHKWADRRPLGEAPGRPVALLLDRDGEVLEAGRANVFAVVDQVLLTPRADGRILPGTARAAAIEVARAQGIELREQRLDRSQLFEAEEVFLTGSVRGVEPAASLDGNELPTAAELSGVIGEGLRRRWQQGLEAPVSS